MSKETSKKEKGKKPNFFVRIGSWFKVKFGGMKSEIKKVSWPKFGTVVKQTGVVLAVVLVFLIVVTLFDSGLTALVGLLMK